MRAKTQSDIMTLACLPLLFFVPWQVYWILGLLFVLPFLLWLRREQRFYERVWGNQSKDGQ